jgi:hypothetical protein
MRDTAEREKPMELAARLNALTEFDDRPRNGDGMFESSAQAGIDPQSMTAAYGPPPKSKAPLLAAGAGTAALAGAGAIGVNKIRSNYGGPGVPFKDSLKAAAGDAGRAVRKRWSRRLAR